MSKIIQIGSYQVERCRCGHRACKDWHVAPVAAMQGVRFTKAQAVAVATLLDNIDVIGADFAPMITRMISLMKVTTQLLRDRPTDQEDKLWYALRSILEEK